MNNYHRKVRGISRVPKSAQTCFEVITARVLLSIVNPSSTTYTVISKISSLEDISITTHVIICIVELVSTATEDSWVFVMCFPATAYFIMPTIGVLLRPATQIFSFIKHLTPATTLLRSVQILWVYFIRATKLLVEIEGSACTTLNETCFGEVWSRSDFGPTTVMGFGVVSFV